MKEQDAIAVLEMVEAHDILSMKAKEQAILALDEIQDYKAIGTVEECREAVEKQKPTEPYYIHLDEPLCPYCHGVIEDGDKICDCGQRISW